MPIAIDPESQWPYTLREERGQPNATTFKLKALTVAEEGRIRDSLASVNPTESTVSVRSGTHELEILRAGLVGVENFFDAAGGEVPFESVRIGKREVVSDKFLARLAPKHRQEIAEAIMERNTVTDAERKNS